MGRELIHPKWNLIYAHRLVHIENVRNIVQNGIVHWASDKKDPNYISIGDPSIINVRKEERIQGYLLSDYIPFYFGVRMPMLYVIQNGTNGVTKRNAEDIVYCVIKLELIIKEKIECIFTDGHAMDGLTKIYPGEKLNEVQNLINSDDVYAKYWNDANDLDLKRRKQAELLIKNDLKAESIAGFFVYNETAKQKLEAMGALSECIKIFPNYYF